MHSYAYNIVHDFFLINEYKLLWLLKITNIFLFDQTSYK